MGGIRKRETNAPRTALRSISKLRERGDGIEAKEAMDKLRNKILSMPDTAGVYIMKDNAGRVIYVGKANSLKKRLRSYIGRDLSSKTVALMSHVADIEFELCPTESLALLREANLINKYQPKYNIVLPDDRSFPMVKITNEDFPAIFVTRKKENDGAWYLGPYTSANLLREALKIIRRSFPFRSCRKLPKKACIYYRLNLSPAPCIGKISKKAYANIIEDIILILEGKAESLIKRLSAQMQKNSRELKYEKAARLRDQILALNDISAAQTNYSGHGELEDLKRLLCLSHLPERIEAFDISNIQGKEACGSMVSFYKGLADKNNYRRFRIKTVKGINDYKMISEVVRRRYSRIIEEKLPLPDLILIDGGKAHLSVARKELAALGLNLPIASIAKERENIYTKGRLGPIKLKSDTPALNLIRRVRDEAHRFAVSYHHLLHRKKILGR